MPPRLSDEETNILLEQYRTNDPMVSEVSHEILTDVFIAGSGLIGCTYARTILDKRPSTNVFMAEIGSQDHPVIGAHHKNSIKYQKDFDAFVNVIKGALQPISIPPGDTFQPALARTSWAPTINPLVVHGNNPSQIREKNLPGAAVTRTVGGMGSHWTCACPKPHKEERQELKKILAESELEMLLDEAGKLLGVHPDQFDNSIRHAVIREVLQNAFPSRGVANIPLAVKRRSDNPDYVTWSGSNTVLGEQIKKVELHPETKVMKLEFIPNTRKIGGAIVRDLNTNKNIRVIAKVFVIACGAVGTPQILWNSLITPSALGCYLSEQSMAFCQIVLKREIVESIANTTNEDWERRIVAHKKEYPNDPLPIPFNDPEPQLMIPYHTDHKWHVQIHRDAFSYGQVGPKADPRVVVDLRFFGKSEILKTNKVTFPDISPMSGWQPGIKDIYGMPQATFDVTRTDKDGDRDQQMMNDMTNVANVLGGFLPGSYPQFMEPGLAWHITGTTRLGKNSETSVANAKSKVHGIVNLWVGGNGCIPDATASNPTRTSVAIAIKGGSTALKYLDPLPSGTYSICNVAYKKVVGYFSLNLPDNDTKKPIVWNVEHLQNNRYLVTLNNTPPEPTLLYTIAEADFICSTSNGPGKEWIIEQREYGVNEYTIVNDQEDEGWTLTDDKDNTPVSYKDVQLEINSQQLWTFNPVGLCAA